VRIRQSWTLSALAMTAVMVPGLSMLILGQGTPAGPAATPAAPPLPAARGAAPAGGGGRGGRGGGGGGAPAAPAAPTPRFPDRPEPGMAAAAVMQTFPISHGLEPFRIIGA
jgi:hypothetical protein